MILQNIIFIVFSALNRNMRTYSQRKIYRYALSATSLRLLVLHTDFKGGLISFTLHQGYLRFVMLESREEVEVVIVDVVVDVVVDVSLL